MDQKILHFKIFTFQNVKFQMSEYSNTTFGFQNVKFLKCKIFLINFLDKLGNFKQKNFYTSKCKFF